MFYRVQPRTLAGLSVFGQRRTALGIVWDERHHDYLGPFSLLARLRRNRPRPTAPPAPAEVDLNAFLEDLEAEVEAEVVETSVV